MLRLGRPCGYVEKIFIPLCDSLVSGFACANINYSAVPIDVYQWRRGRRFREVAVFAQENEEAVRDFVRLAVMLCILCC